MQDLSKGALLPGRDSEMPGGTSGHLSVAKVTKSYRDLVVLDDLSLSVEKAEIVSLLGPSGCGKTTLLRLVAGLIEASRGAVTLAGRDITRVPAHKRNVGVVFQSYALFPHLSVAENVAFGLKARGAPRSEIPERVRSALAMVRMDHLGDRSITALSGGQQQRVAVARALVVEPELLLLDEPFSALDRKLRETMQVELKSLLRDKGITAIFVTHDQEEALAVSSRIAVMNNGRIEQFADPVTLYNRPATGFVMDFVGLSTRMEGRVRRVIGPDLEIETPYGSIRAPGRFREGAHVIVAVRPELLEPENGPAEGSENSIAVTLQDVMCLGSKTHLYGAAKGDDRILAEITGTAVLAHYAPGQSIRLAWPPASTLVYAREG